LRLNRRYARPVTFDEPPPPDPAKLLAHWMEWEKGEIPPGRLISNLKTAGLRELLEATVAARDEITSA
jgi:hypothetical protein